MTQMHESDPTLEFDLLDQLAKSLRVSGMKPGDMARALDVHRNTITNYMNGRGLDRKTLIAWSFACSPAVTLSWLETGLAPTDHNDGGTSLPSEAHRVTQEYARPLFSVAA